MIEIIDVLVHLVVIEALIGAVIGLPMLLYLFIFIGAWPRGNY